MKFKEDAIEFEVSKSLRVIGASLQMAASAVKAESIENITSGTGVLEQFDDRADLQVAFSGKTLLKGRWCVQAYVDEKDDKSGCHVVLVAIGEGIGTQLLSGPRESLHLSLSIKKRAEIARAIS